MTKELQYEKKTITLDLCKHDRVIVFNLARLLRPRKERFLEKVLRKLPSREIEIPWEE